MLDWLVIGGGPHGVHAATRLVAEAGVPHDAVRILDDEQQLLARWLRSTRNTGMQYLRSPSVHNIDLAPSSLQDFAKAGGRCVDRPFVRPYFRPSLDLFNLHCRDVVGRHRLDDLHLRGRATRLDVTTPRVRVEFEDPAPGGRSGAVEARRVVLAIGAPLEPEWPDWARRAVAETEEGAVSRERIRHVFDPGFELADDGTDSAVAVIGAGITGAQVALRLARDGRRVILVSRHALRVEQFDSDPGWLGPKHMARFARVRDPDDRRARIRAARNRGSMPPDVHTALHHACADGTIELVEEAEVASARLSAGEVSLDVGGRWLRADRVVLATGYPSRRPGGGWLDELGLPRAACGYPIVDRGLRWHPRLLVTGPLAELELGPVSRNLAGAQRAGERIAAVAQQVQARRRQGAGAPARLVRSGPGRGQGRDARRRASTG